MAISKRRRVQSDLENLWEGKFNELQKGRHINFASIKVIYNAEYLFELNNEKRGSGGMLA